MGKTNQDNHGNQLNPNNDAYWESRGLDKRPTDWEEPGHQHEAEQSREIRERRDKRSTVRQSP